MKITKYARRVSISMSHMEFEALKRVYEAATPGGDKALRSTFTNGEHRAYGRRVTGHAPFLRIDADKSAR